MAKLVNLTPHELNIHTGLGVLNLPSSGIARCDIHREAVATLFVDGLPIVVNRSVIGSLPFGSVPVPEPEADTIYIVSAIVMESPSMRHRRDVMAPGEAIRNADGVVIGCRGLTCTAAY